MKDCLCKCVLGAVVVMVFAAASLSAPEPKTNEPPETFGSITVSRVLKIEPDGTLCCDIDAFPPIVGRNIPVILQGIEPVNAGAIDKDVIDFLEQTLISDSKDTAEDTLPTIVLKNIRRGRTFCLVADVEIDGRDLAVLLVEKGLAQRIIRLESAGASPPAVEPATRLQIKSAPAPATYVAARTSKIYHRSTCPHVKRMTPDKMITFRSCQEAEQNGRRPCKTCNP